MGVDDSAGVELGSCRDAVGDGNGVSDGATAAGWVPVTGISIAVSVAIGSGAVETTDGVAVNAGAVQASVTISRVNNRMKERLLCDITSSAINYKKAQKHFKK